MTDELRTERLRLRQWGDDDLDAWAALNADPEVREFFGGTLTREQSAASMAAFRRDIAGRGWGWWAIEVDGRFAGMAGLDVVEPHKPFTGVEIGWRLARDAWGHGYATEAARAALSYGLDRLRLPAVLAIAARGNARSIAVMRRIGMTWWRDDGDEVVYRIGAA